MKLYRRAILAAILASSSATKVQDDLAPLEDPARTDKAEAPDGFVSHLHPLHRRGSDPDRNLWGWSGWEEHDDDWASGWGSGSSGSGWSGSGKSGKGSKSSHGWGSSSSGKSGKSSGWSGWSSGHSGKSGKSKGSKGSGGSGWSSGSGDGWW
jgi:hypothetical protein